MKLNKTNIRFRLTLWYSITLFVILFLYAGTTVLLTYVNLRHNLDRILEKDYEVVEEMVEPGPGNKVKIDEDDDSFLNEHWVEILDKNGQVLFNTRPFSSKNLPHWKPGGKKIMEITFSSLKTKNHLRLRSLTGNANIEGHEYIFRLFRSEEPMYKELKKFLILLLIALPLALIIAALGGYWLAGRLLSPVENMTSKARQISSSNLNERLPVDNPSDELGRLAITINELLNRIQDSFERLKQFTYDAAHELRTPLTAIRSIGEVALQNPQDREKYREIIGSILEENNRLTNLVNSLLFLSRADSNSYVLHRETVDLTKFTEQVIDFIQPLAEEKGQTFRLDVQAPVMVYIDKTLFRQALLNLLDNAIKYGPEKSTVTIDITKDANGVQVRVTDQGTPVPAALQEKIFERFYRLDKSRSKELGGSGLGLAIARWAIEIQGGQLTMKSKKDKGNTFIIYMPDVSS